MDVSSFLVSNMYLITVVVIVCSLIAVAYLLRLAESLENKGKGDIAIFRGLSYIDLVSLVGVGSLLTFAGGILVLLALVLFTYRVDYDEFAVSQDGKITVESGLHFSIVDQMLISTKPLQICNDNELKDPFGLVILRTEKVCSRYQISVTNFPVKVQGLGWSNNDGERNSKKLLDYYANIPNSFKPVDGTSFIVRME